MSQPTSRFDNAAATWDAEQRRVKMATDIQATLAATLPLSADLDLLDFGCGTGLFSLDLRPRVRSLTGADASAPMLEVFRKKALEKGFEVATRHLGTPRELGGPYHLIMSSMALHHVEDLGPLFRDFHAALAAGGRIALADLDPEDGAFHGGPHADVHHLGFERQAFMDSLAAAGFQDLEARTAATVVKGDHTFTIFLITGSRP
nr:class I SAM-dependent methyltransferase [uncultured Holophaga sp.]